MQKLHLVGLTTDQNGLILSTRRGARSGSFHLPVDQDLAEAVEELRAKQAEAQAEAEALEEANASRPSRVESALSVREIQARLRQGRAVSDVAKAAGVDPEWVERFAAPVFAERAQVISRVRSSSLRRARLGPSVHSIDEAIRRNLADRGVAISPEELAESWSARQLADGRWAVRFRYRHRARDHMLRFDIDESNGTVAAADRSSSQLGYVAPATPPPPAPPRRRPQPTVPPAAPRAPQRATVSTGFRSDEEKGEATSRAAKERARATEAMQKAAAQAIVEAERAAARRERERAAEAARRERQARAEEARKERERAAAERKRAAAAKKKAAEAKKRAAERAKAKAAKQAADQARRAELALRAAERKEAARRKAASKAAKATKKKRAPSKKAPGRPKAGGSKKAPAKKVPVAKKALAKKALAKKAPAKQAPAATPKKPAPKPGSTASRKPASPKKVAPVAEAKVRAPEPASPAPPPASIDGELTTGDVRILGPVASRPRPAATFRTELVETAEEPAPSATDWEAADWSDPSSTSPNGRARERPPGARRTRPLRAT